MPPVRQASFRQLLLGLWALLACVKWCWTLIEQPVHRSWQFQKQSSAAVWHLGWFCAPLLQTRCRSYGAFLGQLWQANTCLGFRQRTPALFADLWSHWLHNHSAARPCQTRLRYRAHHLEEQSIWCYELLCRLSIRFRISKKAVSEILAFSCSKKWAYQRACRHRLSDKICFPSAAAIVCS